MELPPNNGPPDISSYLSSLEVRRTKTATSTLSPALGSIVTPSLPYVSSVAATPTSTSSSPSEASYGPCNTKKRGLCYTNNFLALPYDFLGSNAQASWGYNYFISRITDSPPSPNMRFVPILFYEDPASPTYGLQLHSKPLTKAKTRCSLSKNRICASRELLAWQYNRASGVSKLPAAFRRQSTPRARAVTNGGPEMVRRGRPQTENLKKIPSY